MVRRTGLASRLVRGGEWCVSLNWSKYFVEVAVCKIGHDLLTIAPGERGRVAHKCGLAQTLCGGCIVCKIDLVLLTFVLGERRQVARKPGLVQIYCGGRAICKTGCTLLTITLGERGRVVRKLGLAQKTSYAL